MIFRRTTENDSKYGSLILKIMAFIFAFICFAPADAAGADIREVPDTTVVDLSGLDDEDEEIRVVSYRPVSDEEQYRLISLAADSLPIIRDMPLWAKLFVNSLTQAGEDRTRHKRFDVSFAISPSYTREASFGIGGAVTGLFRINRRDTLPQPSMVFASVNASLNGFYVFRTRGNLYFPDNRSRISYRAEVSRKSLNFWGITAAETSRNQQSKYIRRQIDFQAEYTYRLTSALFAGLNLRADYTDGREFRDISYLLGERRQYYVTGLGINLQFDSRDVATEPESGIYASYQPMVYLRQLGNAGHFFHSHQLTFNSYHRVWKGGVVATDIYAKFNSRHTPWTMREMSAQDGIRLRGYYMGSYIDNNQMSLQAELRQHIWDRLGLAVWGGAATIFNRFGHGSGNSDSRQVWLPNGGIGLRIQFRPRLNGRIDCGFGRRTVGVLFSIGEAF